MEEARPGMKSWRRTVWAGVGRSKTWNEIMEENSRGRSWKRQDLE